MVANEDVQNQVTELYFWGVHSGVGGSAILQPESGDVTLHFVIDEMAQRHLGLQFRRDLIPKYPEVSVEGREAPPQGIYAVVQSVFGKYIRDIESINRVHSSAIKRYQQVASWRPAALNGISKQLLEYPLPDGEY